jgi:hypothetical protein
LSDVAIGSPRRARQGVAVAKHPDYTASCKPIEIGQRA